MKFTYIIAVGAFLLFNCNSKKDSEQTAGQTEGNSAVEQAISVNNENIASADTVPSGPVPVITFKETSYDFGTIKAGDKVRHTFEFTNTGEAPLVIQNAAASCGCTVPEWPKEPIAPGKSGKIEVEYNSAGNSGRQSKTVSITANTNPALTTLNITTVVEAADNSMGPVKK